MFHVCKAVAIGTLTKVDAFVGGVVFETPLTLFNPGLFIVPPIGEGIGGALSLRSLFLGNFSRDVIDDWRGDVIVCVGCT